MLAVYQWEDFPLPVFLLNPWLIQLFTDGTGLSTPALQVNVGLFIFHRDRGTLQTKILYLEMFTQSSQRLLRGKVLNICKDLGLLSFLMTTGKWHSTLTFGLSAASSPLEHPFFPKSSLVSLSYEENPFLILYWFVLVTAQSSVPSSKPCWKFQQHNTG